MSNNLLQHQQQLVSDQVKKMAQKTKPSPESEIKITLKSFRLSLIVVMTISFFMNLILLTPSLYMLQVYDRVLTSRNYFTLYMLTLLAAGLYFSFALLEWVRSRILVRVSAHIDKKLNAKIFSAMLTLGLKTKAAATITTQPLNDINTLRQFMTGNSVISIFDAPWAPIYLFITWMFHPLLGWTTLAGIVILIALAISNEIITQKALKSANNEAIQSNSYATSKLRSAEVFEAMGMIQNILNGWLQHHYRSVSLQIVASDRAGSISAMSRFIRLTLQSLLLGVGAWLSIAQEISPGSMIAASILGTRALSPIDQLITNWRNLLSAHLCYQRLDDLLRSTPSTPHHIELPPPTGELSIENATILLPDTNAPILKNVCLNLKAGDSIGIIGPSGSGKSTLARVILGVCPITHGKTRLDGADINQYSREKLGPYIGYLPQDIDLSDGTVAENIARFNEIDSDRVIEAAKTAGIHELILKFPKGYDSVIGNNGHILSGGQRQRIALARALYGKPSLIVLDEPNSNLDDAGERALTQTIRALRERHATVIIITHRPNILKEVELVFLLKEGVLHQLGYSADVINKLSYSNNTATIKNG